MRNERKWAWCALADLPSKFVKLLQQISEESLSLNLEGNFIDDVDMELLMRWARVSGSMGALQELFLGHNRIGDAGMQAFTDAIRSGSLAKLKMLTLFGSTIGDAWIPPFASAIHESLPLLQHADVRIAISST